jgi:hypothetical protein
MINNKRFIIQISIFSLLSSNAHAYFDHGTGSLLIQSTIAFIGMLACYFRALKARSINFFKKLFIKIKPNSPSK